MVALPRFAIDAPIRRKAWVSLSPQLEDAYRVLLLNLLNHCRINNIPGVTARTPLRRTAVGPAHAIENLIQVATALLLKGHVATALVHLRQVQFGDDC